MLLYRVNESFVCNKDAVSGLHPHGVNTDAYTVSGCNEGRTDADGRGVVNLLCLSYRLPHHLLHDYGNVYNRTISYHFIRIINSPLCQKLASCRSHPGWSL